MNAVEIPGVLLFGVRKNRLTAVHLIAKDRLMDPADRLMVLADHLTILADHLTVLADHLTVPADRLMVPTLINACKHLIHKLLLPKIIQIYRVLF